MGRPSKDQRLAEVHEAARREFAAVHSAGREVRDGCVKDIRFALVDGSQWEGVHDQQVNNKPMFEFNKVGQSVDRIETDFRNNRMDVAFESKDGSPAGKLPDTCASLYRADEQDSRAQRAYGNGFKELVAGGVGSWRLRAVYADENSEEGEDDADEARPQRIRFESITGAASCVFFDPNAKEVDKSDARFCYVLTSMTVEQYKRDYDDDPADWPNDVNKYGFEWSAPNSVFLAEYYVVEPHGETIVLFRGLDGDEIERTEAELEDPELARELEATGYTEDSQRKSKRRRIHKYLMNGARVIEECYIAGRHIPIVVAYANRIVIDNVEHYAGHVRRAKDPQRILNLMISQFAEICALAPSEKLIVTPDQIKGHEATWADDNVKRYAYRLINPLYDLNGNIIQSGPVASVKPPEVPPALAALTQLAEAGLQDILGNPRETEKMVSHVPGSRVEMLQQTLDKQSEPYISSMSEAMHRNGVIWLSMARDLYTQPGRTMKGVDAIGKKTQIELMRPIIDPETKKPTTENDLSRAHMDVVVTVGPSSESQRQAAFDASTSVLPVVQDQETQRVLSLHATRNMPGDGAAGLREWARKSLVTIGAETPTPEDERRMAEAAQNAPPDAQVQYLLAEAEKSKAQAAEILAKIELLAAQVGKTKADTVETLASVDVSRLGAHVDAVKALHEMTTSQQPAPGQGVATSV